MNCDIEFTLNTSMQRFEAWLDRYRLKTTPFILDLKDEKKLHIISAPTLNRKYQGLRVHEIRAAIGKPDPKEPDMVILYYDFPVISLELFEPAENRLNMKVACNHESLTPYYLKLLGEIVKLWPEVEEPVIQHITSVANHYGVEIPKQSTNKIRGIKTGEIAWTKELEFKLRCTTGFDELEKIISKFSDEFLQPPVISLRLVDEQDPLGFLLRANLHWYEYEDGQSHSEKGVEFGVLEVISGILFGYRRITADWATECFKELKSYLLSFDGFSEQPAETFGESLIKAQTQLDDALNNPEPWQQSPPKRRERDRIIWEMRNDNNTWEDVAEKADCGVTTAKEVYKRLKIRLQSG